MFSLWLSAIFPTKTDQGDFSEAYSGCQKASRINPGEIGASAAAKEA
jgi:hypothetical protein